MENYLTYVKRRVKLIKIVAALLFMRLVNM